MSTLFLCILLISFSAAEAAENGIGNNISTSKFPQKQAEKLIRDLNLSPKLDANIVDQDDPAAAADDDVPRIVEKSFQFPRIAANSTTVEDFGHHAGYYRLPHTKGARMFYYFFESRIKNASAPVVVWLTGGPGCSSAVAMFYENGPFHLTKDNSLVWNEFGWDQASNLIYVDQPTGTGFSYSTTTDDLRHTSDEAGVDFSDFLQAFFEKHPRLAKNDLYITGESYAGHYIPAFAAQIQSRNKNKQGIRINLKGLAIGNGLTNPEIQYKSLRDYALSMRVINRLQYYRLTKSAKTCEIKTKACGARNSSHACEEAYEFCNGVFNRIINSKPGINYYDIRKNCSGDLCYDFSQMETFLNSAAAQRALGVSRLRFVSCSSTVFKLMSSDMMRNYESKLPPLLQEGIKVLIYAGEFDLICNWVGNLRWVENLQWAGKKRFAAARVVAFNVGAVEAGLRRSYGGLSFLKVYNGGHMVPMDQPMAALEMLRRFMEGQFW